jgi:hypothetical protein
MITSRSTVEFCVEAETAAAPRCFVGQALMASAVPAELSVARSPGAWGLTRALRMISDRYPAQQLRRSVLATTFDDATAEFRSSRLTGMLRFHKSIP